MGTQDYARIVMSWSFKLCNVDVQPGEFGKMVLGAMEVICDERSWVKDRNLAKAALNEFFEAVEKGDSARAHTVLCRWGIRPNDTAASLPSNIIQWPGVPARCDKA